MKDLKNRMDGLQNDFDKESLWNSIDSQVGDKRKRRGALWFWFLGASFLIGALSLLTINHFLDPSIEKNNLKSTFALTTKSNTKQRTNNNESLNGDTQSLKKAR